jgi:hypothetical protein
VVACGLRKTVLNNAPSEVKPTTNLEIIVLAIVLFKTVLKNGGEKLR